MLFSLLIFSTSLSILRCSFLRIIIFELSLWFYYTILCPMYCIIFNLCCINPVVLYCVLPDWQSWRQRSYWQGLWMPDRSPVEVIGGLRYFGDKHMCTHTHTHTYMYIYIYIYKLYIYRLGLRRTRSQGSGGNYIMRRLMNCTAHLILFGWQKREEWDGWGM